MGRRQPVRSPEARLELRDPRPRQVREHEQFDEFTLTVEEWRDSGDWVGVLGRVHVRGRQMDIAFDYPVGFVVEIQDGQVVRMETSSTIPPTP